MKSRESWKRNDGCAAKAAQPSNFFEKKRGETFIALFILLLALEQIAPISARINLASCRILGSMKISEDDAEDLSSGFDLQRLTSERLQD